MDCGQSVGVCGRDCVKCDLDMCSPIYCYTCCFKFHSVCFTFTSVFVSFTCIKPQSLSQLCHFPQSWPWVVPVLLQAGSGPSSGVRLGKCVGGERDEGWRQPVIASLNNPLHLLSQPCVPEPCVSPTTTYHLPCLAHTPPGWESSQTHSCTPHAQAFRDTHNREASPDRNALAFRSPKINGKYLAGKKFSVLLLNWCGSFCSH